MDSPLLAKTPQIQPRSMASKSCTAIGRRSRSAVSAAIDGQSVPWLRRVSVVDLELSGNSRPFAGGDMQAGGPVDGQRAGRLRCTPVDLAVADDEVHIGDWCVGG